MKKTVPMLCVGTLMVAGAVWMGLQHGDESNPGDAAKKKAAPPKPAASTGTSITRDAETQGIAQGKAAAKSTTGTAEMAAKCEAVFAITNATARQAAFEKLLAEAADPAALKSILDTLIRMAKEGRRFDAEWFAFWRGAAHRDPKMAAALLGQYDPKEKWYVSAVGPLIQEWASSDPAAAIQWLAGNKALTGETLDFQTINLVSGYAGKDLKAATDYALSVFSADEPIFRQLGRTLTSVAMQQGGTEGLMDWFRSLPNDAVRQGMFQSVAARMGELGLDRQREWLAAEAGHPYRNDQTYRDYMGDAAKTDPRGTLEFAFSLPTSPHQPGVYVGVGYAAFEWLARDEASFTTYYQSLPANGVQRQQIVKALNDALGPGSQLPPPKRDPALRFLQGLN